MKIYNTLSGKKEEFVPLTPGKVMMYSCGPTVYNFFHIGNARCFVIFDLLRRYLEYRGYEVKFVQNFTDIDDKMIKKANEEGVTVREIAERYIAEYETDARGLGIRPASVHPRATENIDAIIEIISRLIEDGFAYESDGDVYFSTEKDKEYGKLSKMNTEDLLAGARIAPGEKKRSPLDFALWKGRKEGEPYWPSPFGEGRPGWHIECSAMSRKYLGETIDIHGGGQDLIFPHHENEIAQSECSCGKPFVRYFMHNGYINVNHEKMSKSKGNFFTVRDVAKLHGYMPIRYFLLSAQYRSQVNYDEDALEQAEKALSRIWNTVDSLEFYISHASDTQEISPDASASLDKHKEKFIAAMDDDLNTADALGALFELVKESNTLINGENPAPAGVAKHALELLRELISVLGFEREEKPDAQDGISDGEIENLIAERAAAKKEKNYARADEIRDYLSQNGITLEDTPQGTKFRRG